jgi:hypothetical protein
MTSIFYLDPVRLPAAVAVACTSFAGGAEERTPPTPLVASKTMTDTDMDKVTDGREAEIKDQGVYTASLAPASSNASSQGQAGASPNPSSQGLHGIGRCNNSLCF